MDFRPVSLRTKDRDLFGAWAALNKMLAVLGGNPLLSPAYNAEGTPIPDGSVLTQVSGVHYVSEATSAPGTEVIGISYGVIPAAGTGLVQTGGRHAVRMEAGLGGAVVEGAFVYRSATGGVASTTAGAQSYGFGIITDATDYDNVTGGTVVVQLKRVVAPLG